MKSVLQIEGMSCGKCVARVDTALRAISGVSEVTVNLAAKQAEVAYDPTIASLPDLTAAVSGAGYGVSGVRKLAE